MPPSLPRKIFSGIGAGVTGSLIGATVGLTRTVAYDVDALSRIVQGFTTGLIFKKVFTFCPRNVEIEFGNISKEAVIQYNARHFSQRIIEGNENPIEMGVKAMFHPENSSERHFKPLVLSYDSRAEVIGRSVQSLWYVISSPIAAVLNMFQKGFQGVRLAYNIYSGQYKFNPRALGEETVLTASQQQPQELATDDVSSLTSKRADMLPYDPTVFDNKPTSSIEISMNS